MATHAFLLIAAFAAFASSLVPPIPSVTSPSEANANLWQGWTPRQTQGPLLAGAHDLYRRSSGTNTCGYINGDLAESLTCGLSYACAINSVAFWAGCCPANDVESVKPGCSIETACVPNGQGDNINVLSDPLSVSSTWFCGTASPYCYTQVGVDGAGQSYYNYGCSANSGALVYYFTAFNNVRSSPIQSTIPFTPSSFPFTSVGPTTVSSVHKQSTGGGGPPPSTTATAASKTNKPKCQGSNCKPTTDTAAIAGGVVGGIAALAIIGGIVWLVLRKKRDRIEAVPEVSVLPNK